MPYFGNKVHTSGAPGYLSPADLFGHFHPAFMASWGMPIPDCTVKKIWVYACGPPILEPNAINQFGIYDASSGTPLTYPLVATSPTFPCQCGTFERWWSVDCSIPLPAGTYSLAILSNSAGDVTAGIYFDTKINGESQKTGIAPGVFPDPLGIVTQTTQNWTIYADYVVAGGYTPTAASQCQPKCGEG